MYGESNMETDVTIYKIDNQWEFAVWLMKLKQGLCNNLEGWDGEGDGMERIYVYLWLIHIDIWQKTTKLCKAIILQLINNFKKCLLNTPRNKEFLLFWLTDPSITSKATLMDIRGSLACIKEESAQKHTADKNYSESCHPLNFIGVNNVFCHVLSNGTSSYSTTMPIKLWHHFETNHWELKERKLLRCQHYELFKGQKLL